VPDSLLLAPGPHPRSFRAPDGRLVSPPADWACLPPGDATLTRRVKAAGPSWTVQEKKGRKTFSHGVWAPKTTIDDVKAALLVERQDPAWQHKQVKNKERREQVQAVYAVSFEDSVRAFLAFHDRHHDVATALAARVAAHATPVGSGTVARTKRIPIEERAAAAVIAWLRHQTTGYDDMVIPRQKGARREVRRMLAERSRRLLERYRSGADIDDKCPLRRALQRT
jgi:hypothetical protein